MARKIASILEGGDPTQKGASKFEKQRQRAEKYTLEAEARAQALNTSNYRPLRPMQPNELPYSHNNHQQLPPNYDTSDVPNCIKNSLNEAQYMNPLRYVGAPEEFKQIHMQVGAERFFETYRRRASLCLGTCHAHQYRSASGDESRG